MASQSRRVLKLPDGFPKISSGTLLRDGKTLVTGHKNGYLVSWDLTHSEPRVILRASSEVHCVVASPPNGVFVGCNAGDLYFVANVASGVAERIFPPTDSKYDRVFRIHPIRASRILVSSTYGVLKLVDRTDGGWKATNLSGHANAVFAIAQHSSGWLATGDYRGNVVIWRAAGETYEVHQRLLLDSYVSGLTFLGEDLLAAVTYNGKVHVHEFQPASRLWKSAFETDTASGIGTDIAPAPDSKSVFAATIGEVIRVDPGSQQVDSSPVKGSLKVFPGGEALLALTEDGARFEPIRTFQPTKDLVRFSYLKVALLGNTAFGKSTLSSAITTGNPGSHLSTFGRRVWTWPINSAEGRRRILLNDIGGQEQVIATSLHMAADSDVVLLFFKQTDIGGFKMALELHRRLRPRLGRGAKSYLVETFTDHTLKAVSDEFVVQQAKSAGIDGVLKVCPLRGDDVERFKEDFVSAVDWGRSRKAVQSASAEGILTTISTLKQKGATVVDLDTVKRVFEQTTGSSIYVYHLKFLLQNLTDLGEIEYYPGVSDKIVLDDPEFNELRTNIPVFASERGGIVRVSEVNQKFRSSKPGYVAMLDRYYVANGIAVPFADDTGRLFPMFLENRPLRIPGDFAAVTDPEAMIHTLSFPTSEFDQTRFLQGVCDLALNCVDATSTEGLFSWGLKAGLYFRVQLSASSITGPTLAFQFKTAGREKVAYEALDERFARLLVAFYGQPEAPPERTDRR
ncbi:MAG: hypothetical protein L3K19_00215 [Thermoplasmata archaeon]|nr:hypothetical protein [Thermoplasmata archaeon]